MPQEGIVFGHNKKENKQSESVVLGVRREIIWSRGASTLEREDEGALRVLGRTDVLIRVPIIWMCSPCDNS